MIVVVRSLQFRLLILAALAAACAGMFASRTDAAEPAVFEVGAAARSIAPDSPQYIGGYDYKGGPTMVENDPLEVRAFVVGKGKEAAVFVSADLTGWFSAYQGPELNQFGIDRTREKIAASLNGLGYEIDRSSVIIASTHTHSAPAIVGIWGPPDKDYIQKVSDQAVAAATEAAANAKPSEIWTAVGNVRSFVWQNGQGTNHPDGFPYDNELPIMWARDPETGATNALYANVPNHPDQFRGSAHGKLSADWVGYARKALDELNGGTAVIAPGTLGRQEPPGSVNTYDEVIPQGKFVANEIQRTMARATPLTSDEIGSAERHLEFEADNGGLLLLINFYGWPGACFDDLEYCTIPRSRAPEYFTPANGPDPARVGVYTNSIRIGDLIYSTNPGEAFPEVNTAIRESIQGERHANVVGMTDMLGYYYVRDDYTEQQFGSSNFATYNVGEDLPQMNADLARQNAADLGFQTTPKTVHAPYDEDVFDRPGVQWYPDNVESADPTFNIYGSSAKSQDESVPAPATIDWDFGDGTTDTTANQERFDHTFSGPGTYEVKATVTGDNTKTRTWVQEIVVNPPLEASATQTKRAWNGATLEAGLTGGSGEIVSAHWTCQDGTKVSGLKVVCEATQAGTASVTVVDGAGDTAEATVQVTKAPPKPAARLKITKVRVTPRKVRRGKAGTLVVTVRNTGNAVSTAVKVCARVQGRARRSVKPKPACRKVGRIGAGKSRNARIKLRTTTRSPARAAVKVTASAKGAKKATKKATLRTRR